MFLRDAYAMPSTDIGDAAISLPACYAMSGTEIGCAATRLCYAISGTEIGYGATRIEKEEEQVEPTLSCYAYAV
eukprot:831337-Rhodomonas_salina.1